MKLFLQMSVLSSANLIAAFAFQWYVFVYFGPGTETDALFAGMTVPQLVLMVVSGSLVHVLVPLLSTRSLQEIRNDAWAFVGLVGCFFGMLSLALHLSAAYWVPLTVPGFSQAARELTVQLTRVQLLGIVFAAFCGVQTAAFHARHRFLWAEGAQLLSSLLAFVALMWALPLFGVVAAAWISVARMVLQSVLLAPGIGRPVWPDMKNPVIIESWRRIKPLLIGTTLYKTEPLVDRVLLSLASAGSLSLYYLAQQIYGAASQVLGKAFVTTAIPTLSNLHREENESHFLHLYTARLSFLAAISAVTLLLVGFFGEFLLSHVIGYGALGSDSIHELWWLMVWLGGMLVGGTLGQLSSAALYSIGDTRTPTRFGVISYSVFIPIKALLFYFYGIKGLSFAVSMFSVINFAFQHFVLTKKHLRRVR